MNTPVTLQQVESLATQLPPAERLRLAAHICDQLSLFLPPLVQGDDNKGLREKRQEEVDALLAILDGAAELCEGESDSAEEIRQIRIERDEQICQSR